MRIWNFLNYRSYLLEKMGGKQSRTGLRKKLAAYIPVHTTFISQVLQGHADLSLEQGEAVNSFLEHTEDEGEYFILLLLKDRAGTKNLKQRFESKVKAMRDQRMNIQKRIGAQNEISDKDRQKFYSSYYYGAIHVLTSIPEFRTIEKLAESLHLTKQRVQEMVDFCVGIGVLVPYSGGFKPGSQHIHIAGNSELVLKHHSNWRQHTIQSMHFLEPDDLHYSACVSISQADAFKIKETILENLKSHVDTISKSPEEVAYVLNFDFYKLIHK